MTEALFMVIALVTAVICLFVGGVVALREADTPGDLALLSAIVVLFAVVGGMMWPLTLVGGGFWGLLLVLRNAEAPREKEQAQAFAPENDAAKYRRMAREERDLARLHRNTPELAKMHEQLAQQYDGMADIYSG